MLGSGPPNRQSFAQSTPYDSVSFEGTQPGQGRDAMIQRDHEASNIPEGQQQDRDIEEGLWLQAAEIVSTPSWAHEYWRMCDAEGGCVNPLPSMVAHVRECHEEFLRSNPEENRIWCQAVADYQSYLLEQMQTQNADIVMKCFDAISRSDRTHSDADEKQLEEYRRNHVEYEECVLKHYAQLQGFQQAADGGNQLPLTPGHMASLRADMEIVKEEQFKELRQKQQQQQQHQQLQQHHHHPQEWEQIIQQLRSNQDADIDFWSDLAGDECPACGNEVKGKNSKKNHYIREHYDRFFSKYEIDNVRLKDHEMHRFIGMNLGCAAGVYRSCLICSEAILSRTVLLSHYKHFHHSKFASFCAGYTRLQQRHPDYIIDKNVHDWLESHEETRPTSAE